MNETPIPFPKPVVVFSRYCRNDIKRLFMRQGFGHVDEPITDIENYPVEGRKVRVDLRVRESSNLGSFIRFANILELGYFALKHSWFVELHEPIEGFDLALDALGQEVGSPYTRPYLETDDRGVGLHLAHCSHRHKGLALVVTHILRL